MSWKLVISLFLMFASLAGIIVSIFYGILWLSLFFLISALVCAGLSAWFGG